MFVHTIKTTMKNLRKLAYLLIAGALVVACGKDEKKSEGTAQEIAADADTTTYKIDPSKSEVKWLGKKVTGQHNGKINIQEGEVIAAGENVIGGTVVFDMASITSEDITDAEMNGKLIGHLKSPDFFATDSFPTSTFKLKSITNGAEGMKNITGDLTIKNITNEISFPAEVKVDSTSNSLQAKGKTTIDRTQWNIRYGSGKFFQDLGDKAIYDEVELELDVTATK